MEALIGRGRRVYVFVGGSGAGKSELAVNLAFALSAAGRRVRFFDLDQTKPLFRSRQVAERMQAAGIAIGNDEQVLDARTVPAGILARLGDPAIDVVLDVGGDALGAIVLGQFAGAWGSDVAAFLVINPYRAFATTQEEVAVTIDGIVAASRLPMIRIIANPNFGAATTVEDAVSGYRLVDQMLAGSGHFIEVLSVHSALRPEVAIALPGVNVASVDRYIVAPWEESQHGSRDLINGCAHRN
jgi:hypothetical protein